MPDIQVLNVNTIKLAIDTYSDATGFIKILQQNQLEDWVINAPVIVRSLTTNLIGDNLLIVEPTKAIKAGMLVYCDAIDRFAIVLGVEQVFTVQEGLPFCSCHSQPPAPERVLPPSGTWIATNVTITPTLIGALLLGSLITFAVGTPTTLNVPPIGVVIGRGIPT